jgi:HEPN domain-containing protein
MQRSAKDEGMRWLEQARADRHGAQLLFDGGSYHLACFISQQIAEKALKAFLYANGEELVIGHSVQALADWAAELDSEFAELREAVAPLDGYYIPTRYPNALPDGIPARVYTRAVAAETLRPADLTLDLIARKIQ